MDRMERVSEAFHNMYWTRVISVDDLPGQEIERQEMAADIINAWNEVDELSALLSLGHRVHFDPRQFVSEHPAPD